MVNLSGFPYVAGCGVNDPFQRSVLREVVIIKMRKLRRIRTRFRPVKARYW